MSDVNGSVKQAPKLSPGDRRSLCRELATGEVSRADLARRYGVTRGAVTLFAQRHAAEIASIAERLDDDFAGLWIADKGARLTAYQDDHDTSMAGEYAGHYEHIRTRNQIRQAVADELGQLPPRATTVIMPVVHIVEGVDTDALR